MSTASTPADHSTVTRRNPPTMWDSTANGHSQISIAEAGRMAYLSGQIATSSDGAPLPANVRAQAERVTLSLKAALEELRATARDIVMLRLYVVDGTTERFLDAYTAVQELLGGEMPSVTVLGVQSLFTPELQVEIEMTVRVP
ncbi:MAG TPA: RidA family protein [Rhizorhapis sp.]|nr:RidA family protein [Rhizorhapis sp.]